MFRRTPKVPPEMTCCTFCGEPVRADANACRHCGSSSSDGWSDPCDEHQESSSGWDDDGAEDDEFDYDEYVARHHRGEGDRPQVPWTDLSPLWRWTAVGLLVVFLGILLASILRN